VGKKKRELAALEAQLAQLRTQLSQEDPTIKRLRELNEGIINWHTGAGGMKDIYKHPTLAPKLAVYQLARDADRFKRVGKGLGSLGLSGGTSSKDAYSQDLALEDSFRRSQAASGSLEQSLAGELEMAEGNLGNYSQMTQNRLSGAYSMMDAHAQDLRKRIANSGWAGFAKGLLKYGLPIAMTAATGGMSGGAGAGALAGLGSGLMSGGGGGSFTGGYGNSNTPAYNYFSNL
jgi:hypothetical protein